MANLIQDNKHLEERLDSHGARLYTLENLNIPQQVSKTVDEIVTDAADWAIQAPLRNRFRDLPEVDMKEILHQRMWETNSYKTHKDHMMLYEALKKSMNCDHSEELLKDLAEACKKKKKRHDIHQKCHLGLHLISHLLYHQQVHLKLQDILELMDHHKCRHHLLHLHPLTRKTTTDTRLRLSISSTHEDLQMDDDMAPDAQAQSSHDEDIMNAHIPKAFSLASTYPPPPEDLLLVQTGDMAIFMDCKLKPQDLEGPAFELVKVFHPNVIHLQYQMEECHKLLIDSVDDSIIRHNVSKPLPLGGPPGQVIIQSDFFFNKDLEYLRYSSKGSRPAIEVFSMYGYDYMKKIVLRRANLNEHIITKRDFKYLYPSDFEDLYLLNLQGHLNHRPPKDKKIITTAVNLWTRHLVIRQRVEDFLLGTKSYQTQLNLTKPRWDATGFEYKHDYTIDEALDYRVKEFKVNRMNPGLNIRFCTRKDVDRSKEFMFAIQKQLKTRRIFRILESFVGGRVREETKNF
nr:hypothetical protein [Tanacetum cinerariifolium]